MTHQSGDASDEQYMRMALGLADKGFTHPNPMVGCVLVRGGKIIGEGYHHKAGDSHAEAMALLDADGSTVGATAYVTLEPCAHFGRTPPCADALVDAGISLLDQVGSSRQGTIRLARLESAV